MADAPGGPILIADDDRAVRTVLVRALERCGHQVRATDNAATLWRWVNRGDGRLVITDVALPDGDGLDIIPKIHGIRPGLRVIAISAQNTLLTAVRASERGAFDYLPKPFDLADLEDAVARALRSAPKGSGEREAPADADDQAHDNPVPGDSSPLIGSSPVMQQVYRAIARLADSDLTVLISGESGTGKELVARALHTHSRHRDGPFVAINMAAIPRELIESELFGHEKGAFTGAVQRFAGRFEQARGGTLFLDEIGDMPNEAQTRLLRVLQEGEYMTVGGRRAIRTDARIIAATHRDLRRAVADGGFRADLYYRLNVAPLHVPPLRERAGDIPDLARYFLQRAAERSGDRRKSLSAAALQRLARHAWPGNVRELENLARRISVLFTEDVIDDAELADQLGDMTAPTPEVDVEGGAGTQAPAAETEVGQESRGHGLGMLMTQHLQHYFAQHGQDLPAPGLHGRIVREVERPLIELSLEATRGNQLRAAALLGLNRNTLRKKISGLGIRVPRVIVNDGGGKG